MLWGAEVHARSHCAPGTADNEINQREIHKSRPSSATKSVSLSVIDIRLLLISRSHFSYNKESLIPLRHTLPVIISTQYVSV